MRTNPNPRENICSYSHCNLSKSSSVWESFIRERRKTMLFYSRLSVLFLLLLKLDPILSVGREGLQLVFEDNFDSDAGLNTSIWKYNYPWGSLSNHQANMIARQVKLAGKNQLTLTAIALRTSSIPSISTNEYGLLDLNFTSGALYTSRIQTIRQGLTIVKMRVPSVTSTWPMITLVPIDETLPKITMEVFDDRRNLGYSFGYTSPTGTPDSVSGTTRASFDTSLDFHSFSIDCGYDKVSFFLDNILIRSFTKADELKQISDMSLVIGLGVGGRSRSSPPITTDYPTTLTISNVQMWQPKYDGRFKVMNVKSKLFLSVEYGSFTDTARVVQSSFTGANSQIWEIKYVGNNAYKLINVNSRKAMDVFDWQTSDGAKVIQFRFDVKDNQIWRIVEDENDSSQVSFINVWAQKAASFDNGSTASGSQVVISEFTERDDQKWILIPF